MKVAWRIRRLALQQGVQSRPSIPLRFASTSFFSAASPIPSPAAVEQERHGESSHTHLLNQAGPSNYASLPPHPPATTFFTSHRPVTSSLFEHLATFSDSDNRILAHLENHLNASRELRDDIAASGIWLRYNMLSPSAKSTLKQDTLRRILRVVVPSVEHVEGQRDGRRTIPDKSEAKQRHKVAVKYGQRMAQVLRDLQANLAGEENAGPVASDYRFVLSILAHVGDTLAAEVLADGMRKAGLPMDIRMLDSRLAALCKWLRRTVPGTLRRPGAERVLAVLWQIQGDIATFDLVPRNASTSLLIQAIYAAKVHIQSPEIIANLDVLLEDVCQKAYGVDLRYQTLGLKESWDKEDRVRGPHVCALVDYWGGKGDVWKMLSTYEVLAEQSVVVAPDATEEELLEDDTPTLSGMMRQEADDRRGMTMFGRRKVFEPEPGSAVQVVRDLPPHIQLGSSTSPIVSAPTFAHFFPQPIPTPLSTTPTLSYPDSRILTETIAVLIRHAIAAGDIQLLIHILASALSTITNVRTEWLSALTYRHTATGGDPSHPDWFTIPGPRISVNHQWFWDVDLFARKSDARERYRRRFDALLVQARAHLHEERKILGTLVSSPQVAAHPKAFVPADHLGMLNVTEKKLDIVLERSRGSLETKVNRVQRKRIQEVQRQARKATEEREQREYAEEKKRSRGAGLRAAIPLEVSGEQDLDMEVESKGGQGAPRTSGGWSGGGNDGIRLMGVA